MSRYWLLFWKSRAIHDDLFYLIIPETNILICNALHIFFIRITSRVDLAMSVRPYERWDLGHYKN